MKNVLTIGAFNDPNVSEENYKMCADSGINFIVMNRGRTTEKTLEALSYAEKFGLKCIVNIHENPHLLECKELLNYKSFIGFHVYDEPIVDDYEKIKAQIEPLAEKFGEDKLFFVNLYPDQWDQNTSKLHAKDYPDYVDRYCKEILLNVKGKRVLSVDSYPLMYAYDGSGRDVLDGRHLEIYELFAEKAREYNAEFHIYLQTMSYGKFHRRPTIEDMYFQFFTAFAYGAKSMTHFCYYTPGGTCEDFLTTDYAMVYKSDKPTEIYYFVKKVNAEMQQFADLVLESTWVQTAFIEGNTSFDEYEGKNYLRHRTDKVNGISSITAEYEAIVGELDYNDDKMYIAVNFTNPCHKKKNTIKMSFTSWEKAIIHSIKGNKEVLLNNGLLEYTLDIGEGIFITRG